MPTTRAASACVEVALAALCREIMPFTACVILVHATLGHADLRTTSTCAHARATDSSARYLGTDDHLHLIPRSMDIVELALAHQR